MPKNQSKRADDFLPLPPASFYILLALADGPQHGYAIMREVSEVTGGEVRLGSGTLYRAVSTMLASGLVEEFTPQRPVYDDARRRYYRLTRFGQDVLTEETRRMAAAVNLARAKRVSLKPS